MNTALAWVCMVGLVFLAAWVLGKSCARIDKNWDDDNKGGGPRR